MFTSFHASLHAAVILHPVFHRPIARCRDHVRANASGFREIPMGSDSSPVVVRAQAWESAEYAKSCGLAERCLAYAGSRITPDLSSRWQPHPYVASQRTALTVGSLCRAPVGP